MLHPGIFLASSLLLAHSHGDLQPSKLHHDSSEARLLQVTSGGNIRGDLLIGVPVSFLFPTIGFNTIYRKSGKQERRMEDRDPEEDWRRNPLLSRLDFFFRSLELDDPSCQQKLICELVQRPDKFSPISDLLMSIFRKSSKNTLDKNVDNSLRWDQLHYSSYIGQNSNDEKVCSKKFNQCSFNSAQLLNLPILNLWQLASKYLNLRIDDNWDFQSITSKYLFVS